MTLFFPKSFPRGQAPRDYIFGRNKTHIALPLDYGSIMNHHKSFNAEPVGLIEDPDNYHFQVRGFLLLLSANCDVCRKYSMCVCVCECVCVCVFMHARSYNT